MSKSSAGALISLALVLAPLGCGELPPAQRLAQLERPNLLLVIVDTLRPDWLEPYGESERVSPELRRLASRGIVFERVLAQSSWTKTSMASLLTSLWPRSHKVDLPTDGLGDGAELVTEVLREAGYATAAVQSNGWLEQSFGFQQGFDHYVFPRAWSARKLGFSSVWPHRDRVLEEARRLLDNRDTEQPLFLYLHFMDVHEYAAPPSFRSFGTHEKGFYLAAIRWVDEALERIQEMLKSHGMLENTVVVFASDHGEAFGENRVYGHANNVFSPVLRVPLIVKLPFDVPAQRVKTQVRNIDIAPTLLDLAGVSIPEGFEGTSLVPLMFADSSAAGRAEDRPSYASLRANIILSSKLQVAVNDGSWTLVREVGGDGKEHLFDLAVDSREDANLIDLEPEQAVRMRALLDAHERVAGRAGVSRADVRIDPAIAERLRAVGYLQ
ncbi:MAG: sulfatase [Myxococcota bacterium]|nr:sulfatase [Myxococcota bacterium]